MLRLALPGSFSPLRRIARAFLLVVGLASVLGCEGAALETLAPGDAAPGSDAGVSEGFCYQNELGACVVTSDGCDPADISGSVVERCATCEVGGAASEICGPARVARCFDLDFGEPCQRCVTDDGAVLYDDCAARADELGDLTCESVAYDSDDATSCEVCRDANGDVVRESCRPNASTCEDVLVNGRECRECFTAAGDFAYRECEPADLDPAVCEVYGGLGGTCVDCSGDDDELLSHECTATPAPSSDAGAGAPPPDSAYCDQVTDPGGRSCTLCYSAAGDLVDEACDDGLQSSPARCEELVFTEQTCLVCVDDGGQEASTQCYGATDSCADPSGCPPAPCENRYLDDGTLCRTCPTAGGEETRCMSGGALVCETVQEFDEAPPPAEGEGERDPAVVSRVCTVCRVDGEVVYEPCNDDGTVPPQPVCSPQTTQDGITCEVCVDPASGEEVYSSCSDAGAPSGEPPAPTPDSCVEEYGVPLRSDAGAQLYLPDDDTSDGVAAEAAIADCFFCSASGTAPSSFVPEDFGACVLQHECTSPDRNTDLCGERVRVLYDPTQCAEPWGQPAAGENALVSAMSWLLEQHGVVVYALDDETVPADFPGACEACDCPRGDRYSFEVSGADAELMVALDVGFYLP